VLEGLHHRRAGRYLGSDLELFSEVDGTWLAAARAQLYRALEVCIEMGPQGIPKVGETFVDQVKLFTAMALVATALLSRYMHLIYPHDAPTNVCRQMEAVENWEADLAGGTVPDYPHPASAPATLTEAFLPYPNIPWDMDEVTGPAAAVMTPIMQWADRYRQPGSCSIKVDSRSFAVRPADEMLHPPYLGE